jgi:cytochrome b561
MEYHTVFDVIQNGVHWLTPFVILVAAALFLLIGWVLRKSDERNASSRGLMFQVVAGIGILGALDSWIEIRKQEYFNKHGVTSGHS